MSSRSNPADGDVPEMDLHSEGRAGSGRAPGAWMRVRAAGIRVPAAVLSFAGVLAGRPNTIAVGGMAALLVELVPRCIARISLTSGTSSESFCATAHRCHRG